MIHSTLSYVLVALATILTAASFITLLHETKRTDRLGVRLAWAALGVLLICCYV